MKLQEPFGWTPTVTSAQKPPRDERLTLEQARERGLTVCGDAVLDLSRYSPRHPGGRFLDRLRGIDATFLFRNTHGKTPAADRVLQSLRVGAFDETSRHPADQDLLALSEEFRREGLFEYQPRWFIPDLAQIILPAALGIALQSVQPAVALLLLTMSTLLACWFVHDIAHNSVFRQERHARIATDAVALVFTGTFAQTYHYAIHRIHHGLTNVLGLDGALGTSPIVWHPSQIRRGPAWLSAVVARAQVPIWFLLILPLVLFFTLALNVGEAVIRRRPWMIAALALRWFLVIQFVFQGHWALALLPAIAGGYLLGFISSLNHFHKEIQESVPATSYVEWVSRVTQNMSDTNWLPTELTGSLNLHIEHHLFPSMPRHNYPRITGRVRELFNRHGLEYSEISTLEAIHAFAKKLHRPFPGP